MGDNSTIIDETLQENEDISIKLSFQEVLDSLPDLNNRYRVLKIIGRGGNSTIVEAKDMQIGRNVALKILKEQYKKKIKVAKRFVNEAFIMGQMQHPGIIPVYNLGKIGDNDAFYSMPIVRGETLRELYENKNRQQLLKLFSTTAHTLAYAHKKDIIHRDLKPENIMVDEYHRALLLDWGLARNLDDQELNASKQEDFNRFEENSDARLTMNGEISGTPAYMAPEQTLGLGKNTSKETDIFAMGVILYEILYETNPFTYRANNNFRMIFHEIKNTTPPFPKRGRNGKLIPKRLMTICQRCIEKVPSQRYPDAEALYQDLDNYMEKVKKNFARKALLTLCLFALSTSVTIFLYLNHYEEKLDHYKKNLVNKDIQMVCMLLNRGNPSEEALNAVRMKIKEHQHDLDLADFKNINFIVERLRILENRGVPVASTLQTLTKGAQ